MKEMFVMCKFLAPYSSRLLYYLEIRKILWALDKSFLLYSFFNFEVYRNLTVSVEHRVRVKRLRRWEWRKDFQVLRTPSHYKVNLPIFATKYSYLLVKIAYSMLKRIKYFIEEVSTINRHD